MTESSSADQEYWVSPFEELAQQEDALRDETQGSGAVPGQFGPIPGRDASRFDGRQGYGDASATQEYIPEQFAAPVRESPYNGGYTPGRDTSRQDMGNAFQEPYEPTVDPYVPAGEPYAPAADPVSGGGPAESMLASWYGPGFHGSPTASGEPFDPYGHTAAHKTLPFGTQLDVSYGGNFVRVTVNDRGPFGGDRELDLSEGAAQALGIIQAGVDYVGVSYPAGGGGYGAGPGTPAVDTSYVPPNAYDPNVPISPGDGIFTPEGGEETSAPYEEFEDQPEVRNDLLDRADQAQTYAPNVPPETFQDTYAPTVDAYVPAAELVSGGGPAEPMLASWYGPGFHGSPTASGEPFDPYGFTAAHPYLPFGTQLDVSYGGNSVPVTVNDRGPFGGGRELDLSEGAAQALGIIQAGVDYVGVSYPGGSGYGAGPGTPAVDTSYVPPNAYDPNVPISPGDGVFTPEGEFGDPYDDGLDA